MFKSPIIAYLFVFIILFEGMYLPFTYAVIGSISLVKIMLYAKYMLSFALFLFFLIRCLIKRKIKKFEILAVLSILGVTILTVSRFLILKDFSSSVFVLYTFPFITFFAGRSLKLTNFKLEKFILHLIYLYTLVFLYAIFDISFLSSHLWADILNQEKYLIDIKDFNTGAIIDGLIGNFYFDPYVLKIRRAIGTQGDPLAFAYSSIIPFAIFIYFKKLRLILNRIFIFFASCLSIIAIILSLTRAIIIAALLNIIAKKMNKYYYIIISLFSIIAMILIVFFNGAIMDNLFYVDSSTSGHLSSLSSITNLTLTNLLVGSIIEGSKEILRFESGFLNILCNYGILILILFYWFILALIRYLHKINHPLSSSLVFVGSVGVLTSIVFSESFYSFTGFGLFWFLAGLTISNNDSKFPNEVIL